MAGRRRLHRLRRRLLYGTTQRWAKFDRWSGLSKWRLNYDKPEPGWCHVGYQAAGRCKNDRQPRRQLSSHYVREPTLLPALFSGNAKVEVKLTNFLPNQFSSEFKDTKFTVYHVDLIFVHFTQCMPKIRVKILFYFLDNILRAQISWNC